MKLLSKRARLAAVLSAAAIGFAANAGAATISGLSIGKNVGNSADFGSGGQALASTVQVLSSGATAFSTRYAANGAADIGAFGSAKTTSLSADYTITFSVTHTAGVNYQIDIGTRLTGSLTLIDDAVGAAGAGNANVSNVSGVRTGGGSLTGGLGLTSSATQGGTSSTSGVQTQVNKTNAATIFAVGTGSAQVYTLRFTFTASAYSPGGISGGDEAAFRLGANGYADSGAFLANTTADNYPGAGSLNRTQSNDGHFVNVTITPEPGTALLIGAGLAGLALRRRRRA